MRLTTSDSLSLPELRRLKNDFCRTQWRGLRERAFSDAVVACGLLVAEVLERRNKVCRERVSQSRLADVAGINRPDLNQFLRGTPRANKSRYWFEKSPNLIGWLLQSHEEEAEEDGYERERLVTEFTTYFFGDSGGTPVRFTPDRLNASGPQCDFELAAEITAAASDANARLTFWSGAVAFPFTYRDGGLGLTDSGKALVHAAMGGLKVDIVYPANDKLSESRASVRDLLAVLEATYGDPSPSGLRLWEIDAAEPLADSRTPLEVALWIGQLFPLTSYSLLMRDVGGHDFRLFEFHRGANAPHSVEVTGALAKNVVARIDKVLFRPGRRRRSGDQTRRVSGDQPRSDLSTATGHLDLEAGGAS